MFEWICFWRRQQSPPDDAPMHPAEEAAVAEPEQSGMSEERRVGFHLGSKDARGLSVVRSNPAPTIETRSVAVESPAKPTLVREVADDRRSDTGAQTRPDEPEVAPSGRNERIDSLRSARIAYFTHGSYAVAGFGGPKLVAPAVTFDVRPSARLPGLLGPKGSIEAPCDNAGSSSPVGRG